jgi:peptide deformylase
MPLKILKFPHPLLRKKARAVRKVTPKITRLIEEMIETVHAAPGIGLAAPQVGESIRVMVIDLGEGPIALINPKIVEKSGNQIFTEGCLSLPGVEAPVLRARQVRVKGMGHQGKNIEILAEGLLATVFQHEIDHLDGIVFIDRVKDPGLIKYVPPGRESREELI